MGKGKKGVVGWGEREGKKKKERSTRCTEGIGPIRGTGSNRGTLLIPGDLPWGFLRSWSELGVALRLPARFDLSWPASHATAITHRPLISIFQPLLAHVNPRLHLRSKAPAFSMLPRPSRDRQVNCTFGSGSYSIVARSIADSMEPVTWRATIDSRSNRRFINPNESRVSFSLVFYHVYNFILFNVNVPV